MRSNYQVKFPDHFRYSGMIARRWKSRGLCLIMTSALLAHCPGLSLADEGADKVDLTEISLERLLDFKVQSVYGASKHEQPLTAAPSSVTIIDSDEIKRLGHRNL